MVMMKIDRPEQKLPTRCLPMPLPMPLPQPGNTVDDATFDMLDGNGNGKIGADEWKGAGWSADRQKAFDADGNGDISRNEFREGRRFEREFNAKDVNGDGNLNRHEFLGRIWRKLGDHPVLTKLPGAKEVLGAGAKAADSIDAMMRRPFPMPLPFKDRFSTFDGNGDGQVSKQEFIAGRRKETTLRPSFPIHKQPGQWPPIGKAVEPIQLADLRKEVPADTQ